MIYLLAFAYAIMTSAAVIGVGACTYIVTRNQQKAVLATVLAMIPFLLLTCITISLLLSWQPK